MLSVHNKMGCFCNSMDILDKINVNFFNICLHLVEIEKNFYFAICTLQKVWFLHLLTTFNFF